MFVFAYLCCVCISVLTLYFSVIYIYIFIRTRSTHFNIYFHTIIQSIQSKEQEGHSVHTTFNIALYQSYLYKYHMATGYLWTDIIHAQFCIQIIHVHSVVVLQFYLTHARDSDSNQGDYFIFRH